MKRWMTLVLAFCLALGLHTTAFSATKVGKVEVAFSFVLLYIYSRDKKPDNFVL